MDVQNVTVPGPIVPMACAQRSDWPTFWGPEIYCTFDPATQDEWHSDRMDISDAYNSTETFLENYVSATETFKCNLQSTNTDTLEATFHCEYVIENIRNIVNEAVQNVSDCVYNTSVVISSVLNPVSEVSLVLPRTYDGTIDVLHSNSSVNSSDYVSTYCNSVHQVLNCRSLSVNKSFYENDVVDVVNSSLLEPIKCFLSYKYFNEPVSIVDHISNNSNFNNLSNVISSNEVISYDWSFLFVIIFIFAGGLGNILVCLAVALDRKLQNVTNYFLFSLAIADLLVSLFVMPLGAIPSFLGEYFLMILVRMLGGV